jgi:hypothetical protein
VLGGGAAAAVVLTHHPKNTAAPPAATQSVTPSSPVTSQTTPPTPTTTVTTPPPTTPATTPTVNPATAQNQAASVNTLLSNGAASRSLLGPATNDAQSCGSSRLAADVNEIRQVRDSRQSELNQAEGLDTGALPNGAALKSDLITALGDSLTVDNDYLNWAQTQANSSTCVNGPPPAEIGPANDQTTTEKNTFLVLWNPIASRYGYATRVTGDM